MMPQSPQGRLAESLGQAIGGAGGNYLGEQIAYQRNRGRLQQALGEVGQGAQAGASPLQTTLSFLNAMAGIPGSERYVSQILPTILSQAQAQQVYGSGQQPPSVGATGTMQPGIPGQATPQPQPAAQPTPTGQQGPISQERTYPTGGVLPRVIPVEEIESMAKQAALISGDPTRYQSRQAELANYNAMAEAAQNTAREKARAMGVAENEIPEFMRLGQRYGYIKNVDEWARETQKDWKQYKSNKEKLGNAFSPGFFRGLVTSSKDRETNLKRLDPIVKDMLNKGFENEAREQLASQGLSPTEVEERIHPLTKETEANLNNFPDFSKKTLKLDFEQGRKVKPEVSEKLSKDLVSFFEKNITPDTPISVLRHKLAMEKNVPWELIGPAVREAIANKKMNLTPAQETEMVEVETQPPRNSLSEIFRDWWRPIEYLKGAK